MLNQLIKYLQVKTLSFNKTLKLKNKSNIIVVELYSYMTYNDIIDLINSVIRFENFYDKNDNKIDLNDKNFVAIIKTYDILIWK